MILCQSLCPIYGESMLSEIDIKDYKQLEMFQPDPLQEQVGGSHYKRFAIQPAEYAFHNHLEFLPANIIKYVTRYPFKNGLQDLEKALHCLQMLIQLEKSKND